MDYISSKREIRHNDVLRYECLGWSDSQISKELGITRAGFRKIRKRMGWERKFDWVRSDKGKPRKSEGEKREGYNRYHREYRRRNGIKRDIVRIGDKHYHVSRLVAVDRILGRDLMGDEVVHHIDGDAMNNEPGNLIVFANQGDHLAFHRGEEVSEVARYRGPCFYCDEDVTLESYGIQGNGRYVCKACIIERDKIEVHKWMI